MIQAILRGLALLVLAFPLLSVFPRCVMAGQFIAIIAADTSDPARTNDRTGTYNLLKTSSAEFAQYAGLSYRELAFAGSQFQYNQVVNAVRSITCNQDDVVFFCV